MSKLYNSIASQRKNVIAIYTGRHPSFVSEGNKRDLINDLNDVFFPSHRFMQSRSFVKFVTQKPKKRSKKLKKKLKTKSNMKLNKKPSKKLQQDRRNNASS